MRKLLSALLLPAIVLSFGSSNTSAQTKLTSDPNAPTITATAEAPENTDPRLAQKITYDSGYKRLHTVVDDISQLSGVSIQSGRNNDDWRVRDIPLVVCVKDMPLGKLLQAISDATHTRFAFDKPKKEDPTKVYRFYRTSLDDKAIDDYLKAYAEAQIARAKWQWNALISYGKSAPLPGVPMSTFYASKLACLLGDDAWNKMLSGETLTLTTEDTGASQLINDLYEETRLEELAKGRSDSHKPSAEDIKTARFKAKLCVDSLVMNFGPVRMEERAFTYQHSLATVSSLQENHFKLPPYPELPNRADEVKYPGAELLLNYTEKWNRPLLTAKFDLEKPQDVKDPTFADLVRAAAQASGCNIVTDDFTSHRSPKTSWGTPVIPDGLFKKDTSLAEIFKLQNNGFMNVWFFNETDKLMIGVCGRFWMQDHREMVPEAFISRLRASYQTTGIEFDDAIHALCLSGRSFLNWISAYEDLRFLENTTSNRYPIFALYDALSASDKLQAQSAEGLSLAKFKKEWVNSFYISQKRQQYPQTEIPILPEDRGILINSSINPTKNTDDFGRALSDPAAFSTIVLHLKKNPAKYRSNATGTATISNGIKQSTYSMLVNYMLDGEARSIEFDFPSLTFPIYSPEREAEIIKAAQSQ